MSSTASIAQIICTSSDPVNDLHLLLTAGYFGLGELRAVLLQVGAEYLQYLDSDVQATMSHSARARVLMQRIQCGSGQGRADQLCMNLRALHRRLMLARDLCDEIDSLITQASFADWVYYARGQRSQNLEYIMHMLSKIQQRRLLGLLNVAMMQDTVLPSPFHNAILSAVQSAVSPALLLREFLRSIRMACADAGTVDSILGPLRILQARWMKVCRDRTTRDWERLSCGLLSWIGFDAHAGSDSCMFAEALVLRQRCLDSLVPLLLPTDNSAHATGIGQVYQWNELVRNVAECARHVPSALPRLERWMVLLFHLGIVYGWSAVAIGLSIANRLRTVFHGLRQWHLPEKRRIMRCAFSEGCIPFISPWMLRQSFLEGNEAFLASERKQLAMAIAQVSCMQHPTKREVDVAQVELERLSARLTASSTRLPTSGPASSITTLGRVDDARAFDISVPACGSNKTTSTSRWYPRNNLLKNFLRKWIRIH